ncbi:hypothetical protein B9479_008232 [Cryptococcus floricola]|uniref:Uncharacterized protein n=1 Tax=Cryptococcus floricola TaxID=2591691 RepID=A0A5D3AKM5_9TREE|nr:hypothetical protein B9479_008232 [Cryptococcus floricola]
MSANLASTSHGVGGSQFAVSRHLIAPILDPLRVGYSITSSFALAQIPIDGESVQYLCRSRTVQRRLTLSTSLYDDAFTPKSLYFAAIPS